MRKLFKFFAILVLAATGHASYAAVTDSLDVVINGSTPSGGLPWFTATFADVSGHPGHVMLTLRNDMGSPQFISDVVFNSLVDPTTLAFTRLDAKPTIINLSQHAAQDMDGGASLKAGLFNIDLEFAQLVDVFNSTNNPIEFDIFGTGLTENSFNLHSLPGGPGYLGNTYLMAAEVQGIGIFGSSGSIGDDPVSAPAVPEPEIYAMMGIGLALMGFVARCRKGQAVA